MTMKSLKVWAKHNNIRLVFTISNNNLHKQGVHILGASIGGVSEALDRALNKGFETVYVHTKSL